MKQYVKRFEGGDGMNETLSADAEGFIDAKINWHLTCFPNHRIVDIKYMRTALETDGYTNVALRDAYVDEVALVLFEYPDNEPVDINKWDGENNLFNLPDMPED